MEKRVIDFMNVVAAKNVGEIEFLQAVEEVNDENYPIYAENPKYNNKMFLERMVGWACNNRVPWLDDNGDTQVNRGYRVEFNSGWTL